MAGFFPGVEGYRDGQVDAFLRGSEATRRLGLLLRFDVYRRAPSRRHVPCLATPLSV
jgi:hypothetical protein